jgi:hypothetical protein
MPRRTKNIVYIQPSMEIFQSQVDEKTCAKKPISAPQAMGAVTPRALDSGSQNTEKP